MTLVVEAMEVDNVMTVGVPGGDAITWDIRYLASCGSNVQLSPHSIKIASAKEKIEQILLFSDESKCSVLQDKNIYISFSLYLTYLILFNDVENIILPSEDWWLHNRKNTYKLILSHIDYCVLVVYMMMIPIPLGVVKLSKQWIIDAGMEEQSLSINLLPRQKTD